MARCENCMTNPVHPDKKCCFNCARRNTDCDVWHNCGEDCPGWEEQRMTNADRIRAMTDEELAELLCNGKNTFRCYVCPVEQCDDKCEKHCMEWLKQPKEG